MPTILMKESASGSPDGISVQNYQKGYRYFVNDDLEDAFVNQMKIAEIVDDTPVRKTKSESASFENKDMGNAPENKKEKKKEIRVYTFAENLGVSTKKIIKAAKTFGISLTPLSILDDEVEEKIRRLI